VLPACNRQAIQGESILIISSAYAQSIGGGDIQSWTSFLPIVLMFVLLYFMMIRPQMKRQKELKTMLDALQKGDEVITSGGVLGRVSKVSEGYVSLEIAANTEVQVQKSAVQTLLPKGTLKNI